MSVDDLKRKAAAPAFDRAGFVRRFDALDDATPITDEEAKSIIEETRLDVDASLKRIMLLIEMLNGEP